MQMRLACSLFLLFTILGHGQTHAWQNPDQAVEALANAVEAVRSFEVTVTATMSIQLATDWEGKTLKSRRLRSGEQPSIRIEHSRQVFVQGKGRVEILAGPGGKPTQIVAYDNEVGRVRLPGEGSAAISRTIKTPAMDGGDYRETYRSVFGGITFSDLVRCFRERKGYIVVKEPTSNHPFLTLEANSVPKSRAGGMTFGEWGFRVGLDTRRGMMPGVIEVMQPIDGNLELYRRTTVNDWKDLGNGLWVPLKATTHVFYLNRKNMERNRSSGTDWRS